MTSNHRSSAEQAGPSTGAGAGLRHPDLIMGKGGKNEVKEFTGMWREHPPATAEHIATFVRTTSSNDDRMTKMSFTLQINGASKAVEVDGDTPLLWVIRDVLGMTGTKFGCGAALCGACTVHLDGVPTRSCVTPVDSVGTAKVTTIEAIGRSEIGRDLQKAWLDLEVVQCGYCQSGQIMSAAGLLADIPQPTDADIDGAMSGNICRCGTYGRIRAAIKQAATARSAKASTT